MADETNKGTGIDKDAAISQGTTTPSTAPHPAPGVGTHSPAGAAPSISAKEKTAEELAAEAKADVAGEAKAAATEAHSRAAALTSEVKDEASKAAEQARRRAEAAANEYKERAATQGKDMAQRLRAAGQEFGEGSLPDQYVGRMADSLSSAADAFAQKDLGSLMADTASFARRNPGAFIGGAALLGFAAARFLKATSPDKRYDDYAAASYDPIDEPAPAPAPRPSSVPTGRPMGSPAVHAPEKK